MNNLSIRKMNELSKKKKKGFTLIELIIVIAIIAILAAIALPKFGQIRENGNVKADIATAKNIQTAVSTAISNGEITLDANGTLSGNVTLATYMDGTVPKPKAQGHTTETFSANVTNVVHVLVGSTEIFPSPAGAYGTALAS